MQFRANRIVPFARRNLQVACLNIRGVGALQAVQHAGVTVSAGSQQFGCLFAREIVEDIVLHGLTCRSAVAVKKVVIVKICVVRCKSVGVVCMDALHGHLLRLCAARGCAQKGQVCDIQPRAAIGFPVRRGAVKGGGVPRLPACAVIVRADKPAQIHGFCRCSIGCHQQILQPGQRQTLPLH